MFISLQRLASEFALSQLLICLASAHHLHISHSTLSSQVSALLYTSIKPCRIITQENFLFFKATSKHTPTCRYARNSWHCSTLLRKGIADMDRYRVHGARSLPLPPRSFLRRFYRRSYVLVVLKVSRNYHMTYLFFSFLLFSSLFFSFLLKSLPLCVTPFFSLSSI